MYCVIGERLLRYLMYGVLALSLMAKSHAIGVNLTIYNNQEIRIDSGDSPEILSDGVLQVKDNYPELSGFVLSDLGSNRSNLVRRTSLFSVTLTGARYGRSITLRAKLGKTIYRHDSYLRAIIVGNTSENNGCANIQPRDTKNLLQGSGQFIFIDPGSHDFTADCSAKTLSGIYRDIDIRPVFTFGDARVVWLDIDTLTASDAWQSLPPDIYNGSVSLNLEYMSNISTGRIKDLNTTTTVSIRKQAYFSGLSVPSTNVAFNTSYTQDQVVGYASTPLILQGLFDPNFGRIRFSLRSDNQFSLGNADGRKISYQAVLNHGTRQYPLNKDAAGTAPIEIASLNNINQIPLNLTFQFNQDKARLTSGTYRDRVVLLAELPLF
ncbi:hypothetical protein DBV23_00960 [Edwardsiella ictaluri]|uniref:Uncharacterized protein n=1 Tax=Edwardsiella ictaluri (strain 93-146) TaxID=634503 RepID=C5B7X9_EDWI9|nr:hypothetical protein [Edwardsiella ictaluri]ACR68715.1 hypothetical protein NT01EI_1529 [Edwardsiella ictaluri 93-146]AVZ81026.1 hypothetical protein DBV23_00960 [Edwardsiella ictaluri]EKS7764643.1 hypothetical protein [Edwardsiella ictaluri]EKS7771694.1 hypothetical protein [Edwardsiella ictaluri]EKS7774866.1 hypothetical protein [Edwardsiella ictaluri]